MLLLFCYRKILLAISAIVKYFAIIHKSNRCRRVVGNFERVRSCQCARSRPCDEIHIIGNGGTFNQWHIGLLQIALINSINNYIRPLQKWLALTAELFFRCCSCIVVGNNDVAIVAPCFLLSFFAPLSTWAKMLNVCIGFKFILQFCWVGMCFHAKPNTENEVEMALTRLVHVRFYHCHCHCHCCCDGYKTVYRESQQRYGERDEK